MAIHKPYFAGGNGTLIILLGRRLWSDSMMACCAEGVLKKDEQGRPEAPLSVTAYSY
ncbi:MAG: hypothetical protein VW546_07440 [Gammaproteobacteria bacterium]